MRVGGGLEEDWVIGQGLGGIGGGVHEDLMWGRGGFTKKRRFFKCPFELPGHQQGRF